MVKVSIIIPTYNVEQYLEECLESVINQTLKDIEIICVNDGSTDNSLSILKRYADSDERIKIIDKANSGYGDSMNKGIEFATGEYIGIVEPDDFIKLNMYETLYNKAKELDLDLIKSDFYRFTGDKNNRKLKYNKLDDSRKYYNKVLNVSNDMTPFKFIMNTWSGIYKREFIEKYHIKHNTTPGASFQDNGFWFQTFMYAKRMYFIEETFYMNRRDNNASSVKNREKVYAMKHEYDFIRNIINASDSLKKYIGIYWFKKYENYMFTLYRIDDKFRQEFLKTFANEFKVAFSNNEIDKKWFSNNQLKTIKSIIENPQKYYNCTYFDKLSFGENIFSIKNNPEFTHKIITICGIKIKFKVNNNSQTLAGVEGE